jgi:protein-tyrosine phosphatase
MPAGDPIRLVELETCCNFRDLGGYPAAGGARTRWRTLFRADGLVGLSDADRAVLGVLAVRSVIDLRSELEVEARGRFVDEGGGVAYHHLPLIDSVPGMESASDADPMVDWTDPAWVARRYASYLDQGTESLRRALDLLAEAENLPAVFHCSVGKDRTGVLAAVVLGLLGVPDRVIVEDYALSARAMARVLGRLRRELPDAGAELERYAPVILSVEPAAMAGFIAAVRGRFGSFESLAAALERAPLVERLRETLLEPA